MPSKNSVATLRLTPMSRAEAAHLVKRMLGSYPSVNLHDPETYIATICSLLTRYPLWAGESAIEKATTEAKFAPPTLGVLKPHLEDEVRSTRYAAEWEAGADHQRLPPPARASDAERAAHVAKRRAELGPTWGIASNAKRVPTVQEARDALVNEIGQAAFDAIPDLGNEEWRTLGEKARALADLQAAE